MQGQRRFLVVDDDIFERKVMELTLKGLGQVDGASTGAEALGLLEAAEYAVAVFDLKLPDVHDLDLLHRVLAMRPVQRAMVVSAYLDRDTIAWLDQEGIPWQRKPYRAPEMLRKLREMLEPGTILDGSATNY